MVYIILGRIGKKETLSTFICPLRIFDTFSHFRHVLPLRNAKFSKLNFKNIKNIKTIGNITMIIYMFNFLEKIMESYFILCSSRG